ncbi:MAG: glycosyltransferase family 39 protein [Acidobacteria bacterium]|nr:glycosyltransferase family 39 protein [Acidobacteriota bacterium]
MQRVLTRRFLLSDRMILSYLALFKLLLHFVTNQRYGYFRDEMYYLACGEHLDWGYVDQSPLIALVAWASRSLMGDSLFAVRFFPAVAGAALVFVTGLIVRELGGGRFSITLACLAVIISPNLLYLHTVLTMNAFEPLFWTLGAYILILLLKGGDQKLWLLFGVVAGLGLMNKHTTLFFGAGVVAGLLLTPARRFFMSKWLWLGGLVALLIFLPNIIWEIKHDWATIEVLRNADKNQNLPFSPWGFLMGQIALTHPLTVPIWLSGLFFYFFTDEGRPYRSLGWIYVSMFLLFVVLRGKVYYLAPIYPVLLAPGALLIESFIRGRSWNWLKPVTVAVLILGGAITAPLTLPLLPVETYIKYAGALGFEGVKTEKQKMGKLPQHYADMFGWEEMVATIAQVYHNLSPEERARCAIFASNFGEAGAIDLFGAKYGLPKAIGKHQNYFLWGPRDYTGEVMITVGEELSDVRKVYAEAEHAATFTNEYVMPYENNLPIFICRRPRAPLKEIWPEVKCYSC